MKTPLLELLAAYTPADAAEGHHQFRTVEFVTQTPACTQRTTLQGHVTASAWILSPDGTAALLTHHKKLNRWMQLGGHVDDDDTTIQTAALREAHEESGITGLHLLHTSLFDLDIHPIPAKGDEPAHDHYDFRFLMQAPTTAFTVSDESHHLAWAKLADLTDNSDSGSLRRMARKTLSASN